MTASLPDKAVQPSERQLNRYQAQTLITALAYVFLLLVYFYETSWSVVSIWLRSDTYAHGFLILPIVGWMIWGRRDQLIRGVIGPQYYALVPLIGSGFFWLLGNLVDVLVVQQFALLGMLISGLFLILGSSACRQIAFPLAYLVFLIPVGEGLVAPMMDFTATFTVAMVELSGIPVYHEGLFFILPTGSWSVVEACSGVRYLIASVALGALYAYLNYQSLWRRSAFMIASIVVPIIANGLRAYIIVMLGHISDMTIATGVDHLIYGWVFFGLVMFLLFYVGSFWRESVVVAEDSVQQFCSIKNSGPQQHLGGYRSAVIAVIAVVIWPIFAFTFEQRQLDNSAPLLLPESLGQWNKVPAGSEWLPMDGGAQQVAIANYRERNSAGIDPASVRLVVHSFYQQSQGSELVTAQNLVVPRDKVWRMLERHSSDRLRGYLGSSITETRLIGSAGHELLVWHWYRVGEQHTNNDYQAKIYAALNMLSFRRLDSARLFIAITLTETVSLNSGREKLQSLIETGLMELETSIDRSAGIDE